jgi:hypothetical protein
LVPLVAVIAVVHVLPAAPIAAASSTSSLDTPAPTIAAMAATLVAVPTLSVAPSPFVAPPRRTGTGGRRSAPAAPLLVLLLLLLLFFPLLQLLVLVRLQHGPVALFNQFVLLHRVQELQARLKVGRGQRGHRGVLQVTQRGASYCERHHHGGRPQRCGHAAYATHTAHPTHPAHPTHTHLTCLHHHHLLLLPLLLLLLLLKQLLLLQLLPLLLLLHRCIHPIHARLSSGGSGRCCSPSSCGNRGTRGDRRHRRSRRTSKSHCGGRHVQFLTHQDYSTARERRGI